VGEKLLQSSDVMAGTSEDTSDSARAPLSKGRIARLSEIAAIMARHGFAPAMSRMPIVRSFIPEDAHAPSKRPAAERFAAMLEELGPTFVKLGQILSTRVDLLPADFITALSRLQDQVPPFPFTEVRTQIVRALKKPLDELFAHIDETPLASASMAQVHAARTHDGKDVVVKVLRPGIEEQVKGDSEILLLLAQLLELVVDEFRRYHATEMLAEFQAALASELDFTSEERNLRAFANANRGRPGVHVPALFPALSGRTVLTMERIHGKRITDIAGTEQAKQVIERLVEVAFENVFVDGLFHGDPHPGNLLVTENGDVAFIDFGLVGRVSREAQDRILMLLLALSLRDADTLSRLIVRLGESDARIELGPFRAQVGRLMDRYVGLTVGEVNTAQVFNDLVDLSLRFGIRLPREFAILSKASVSIEGIVRVLHPEFDPSATITRRAEELLVERVDPRQWKAGGLRSALQLGLVLQEVPLQLGQALMDLERGHIQVTVKSGDLEGLQNSLRGLAMTIFGAVLAGACVIGGIEIVLRAGLSPVSAPFLAAAAFVVAGGSFGVAFSWYLTGGKLPRIGLRRLLPKAWTERSP
jgi:ubiquinone biosynthesis protein